MEGVKSILSSKTFWGAILAVIAGVLGIFGYVFTPEDQAVLIGFGTAVSGIIFNIFAIYGRIVASKKIGSEG